MRILNSKYTPTFNMVLGVYSRRFLANGSRNCRIDRQGNLEAGAAPRGQEVEMGDDAAATGARAVAIGANASAIGVESVAIGGDATTGALATTDGSVAIGNGATAGAGAGTSIVMGFNASSTGAGSAALGSGATVTGDSSIALGQNTIASALESVAIGNGAQATASQTVTLGDGITNSSAGSVLLGAGNIAMMQMSSTNVVAFDPLFCPGFDNAYTTGGAAFAAQQGPLCVLDVNAGGAGNVLLATGAALDAEFPLLATNSSWTWFVQNNLGAAAAATLTASAGHTIDADTTAAIADQTTMQIVTRKTGAATYVSRGVGSATH